MHTVTQLWEPCFERQLKRMHGGCRWSPPGKFAAKICRIRTSGGKYDDSKVSFPSNQRQVVSEDAMDRLQKLLSTVGFRETHLMNRIQQAIEVLRKPKGLVSIRACHF